jgi:hypothetical protein
MLAVSMNHKGAKRRDEILKHSFNFVAVVLQPRRRVMERPLCQGILALVLLVAICVTQIGGLTKAAELTPEAGDALQPLITTSELVVGENRFAFGLLGAGKLLEGADVKLRLYDIDGGEAKLAAELKVPYQAVQNVKQERSVHRHADGTEHVHGDDSSVRGLYVAQLSFTRAGDWGVELLVSQASVAFEPVRLAVTVTEVASTPSVGSAAPRSRNLIARDVKNLRQIDTSPRPDPRLHQVRIADAIAQGKPQLIVFATPQFCTTRMCGPVVDIVRTLLPTYGKRVAFIHQEIWQDFADKKVFSTVEEWRLFTEPWIFVVDGQGIIRAKFEGLVTGSELEAALQQVVTLGSNRRR